MRPVAVVVVGVLVVSGCGAADVTESSEYASLLTENESLSEDLEDARVELGVSEQRLQELDDELTASRAQLSDAEQEELSVRDDFAEFLEFQFSNAGGLSSSQSECLSTALVDDEAARASYFVLLRSTTPDSAEASAAFESLNDTFVDCGLEVPDVEQAASEAPVELPQEVADATRPVEVIGAALPVLTTTDPSADPAVGTAAPVLVGEDYVGQPVRIDAAVSGPTMVVVLAHWCPHCNDEIPMLNQLRDEGRIPDGVDVVAVSSLINPSAANFPPDTWIDSMDWTYPVLADGVDVELDAFVGSNALGVSGVPFTTLIDADGNVAARWAGSRNPDDVAAALETLVSSP